MSLADGVFSIFRLVLLIFCVSCIIYNQLYLLLPYGTRVVDNHYAVKWGMTVVLFLVISVARRCCHFFTFCSYSQVIAGKTNTFEQLDRWFSVFGNITACGIHIYIRGIFCVVALYSTFRMITFRFERFCINLHVYNLLIIGNSIKTDVTGVHGGVNKSFCFICW